MDSNLIIDSLSDINHNNIIDLNVIKKIIIDWIPDSEIFENVFFDWNIIQLLVLEKWRWAWIIEVHKEDIKSNEWKFHKINIFEKLEKLKYLLYDIYISSLRVSSLLNKKINAIQPFVILPNYTSKEIYSSAFYKAYTEKKGFNVKFIWSDELNKKAIIDKLYRSTQNFNDNLYSELKSFANHWLHRPSNKLRKLSDEQIKLINSKPWSQRVKWTAWTGKTTILCSRGMNCLAKRKWRVLFLTYNITLRNLIKKRSMT